MAKSIFVSSSTWDNDITIVRYDDRDIYQMVENTVYQYDLDSFEEDEISMNELVNNIISSLKHGIPFEKEGYTFFYTEENSLNNRPAITFKWYPEDIADRFVEMYIEEEA